MSICVKISDVLCAAGPPITGASQQKLTQLEQESLKTTQLAVALGKPFVISERQILPGSDTLFCRNVWACRK